MRNKPPKKQKPVPQKEANPDTYAANVRRWERKTREVLLEKIGPAAAQKARAEGWTKQDMAKLLVDQGTLAQSKRTRQEPPEVKRRVEATSHQRKELAKTRAALQKTEDTLRQRDEQIHQFGDLVRQKLSGEKGAHLKTKRQLADAAKSFAELKSNYLEMQDELTEVSARRDSSDRKLESGRREWDEMKNTLESGRREWGEMHEEIEQARSAKEDIEGKLADIEMRYSSLQDDHAASQTNVLDQQRHNKILHDSMSSLRADVQEKERQQQTLQSHYNTLRGAAESKTAEISQLQNSLAQARREPAEEQSTLIAELQQQISAAQEESSGMTKNMGQLQGQLTTAQEEAGDWRSKHDQMETQLREVGTRHTEAGQQFKQQLEALGKSKTELQSKYDAAASDLRGGGE